MPLRILAIEDRKSTAARIEVAFKQVIGEVDLQVAVSIGSAKRLLSESPFDIILVGGFLPEEDGGRTESGAGIKFLDFLNEMNVSSRIIFYAGNNYDVQLAATKVVSGRLVQAYAKTWLPGKHPPWYRPNLRYANPNEIAQRCLLFSKQG